MGLVLLGAIVGGLAVYWSWGQGPTLASLATVFSALVPAVLAWAFLTVRGAVASPIRPHWEHYVEDVGDSILFNLVSLHDEHEGRFYEIQLQVDPDDGNSSTAIQRGFNVREGHAHWFQYPQHLDAGRKVKPGMTYRYVWRARYVELGAFEAVLATGAHTRPL